MQIFLYPKLSPKLQIEIDQFEIDHFLQDGETANGFLAHQAEKYYSTPAAWLIARNDDLQIVGRVELFQRQLHFANTTFLMGGMGGVCTHRAMRKQGIASELMNQAKNVLQDWQCDLAYLCTDLEKLASFYAQFGFVALNRPYQYQGKSGQSYLGNDGMIAPIASQQVFDQVLNKSETLNLGAGNW